MRTLQTVLGQVIGEISGSLLATAAIELGPHAVMSERVAVVGCVHVVGPTAGMVAIMCEESLARHAAATMFDLNPESAADPDIRDAVGEFANVAAGNLKATLPEPYRLSMPSVISGNDFEAQVLHGEAVAHAVFDTGHGRFAVSVFQEESAGGDRRFTQF